MLDGADERLAGRSREAGVNGSQAMVAYDVYYINIITTGVLDSNGSNDVVPNDVDRFEASCHAKARTFVTWSYRG
jgi:hypothetical protein